MILPLGKRHSSSLLFVHVPGRDKVGKSPKPHQRCTIHSWADMFRCDVLMKCIF